VHGSEDGCAGSGGALVGRVGVGGTEVVQEAAEQSGGLASIDTAGGIRVAQLSGLPEPEGVEELTLPALKGHPSSDADAGPEFDPDLGGADAMDDVLDKGVQDGRAGIPAPGMDLIREDADGFLAPKTEEAPDMNDTTLERIGEAQDLAPVEAVAHNAQGSTTACRGAAGGALGGAKFVRGGNSAGIQKFCGRESEGSNDSDHDR